MQEKLALSSEKLALPSHAAQSWEQQLSRHSWANPSHFIRFGVAELSMRDESDKVCSLILIKRSLPRSMHQFQSIGIQSQK